MFKQIFEIFKSDSLYEQALTECHEMLEIVREMYNESTNSLRHSDTVEIPIDIYAMDKNNYANLISLADNNEERNKIKMILNELNHDSFQSVPDPYYGGQEGFEKVYKLLDKACEKIVSKIE